MSRTGYSLSELAKYFLLLGATGFGGPVALVGYMHRDLVENRKWITEEDYREGLALAQLAPGPLAAQLAIYIGYIHFRILGATVVGLAFVLPSFLMVLVLGIAYEEAGGLAWMQSLFYGIGAAVIGVIAIGSHKLAKKSLAKDKLLWLIAIVSAVATYVAEREILSLMVMSGVVVWIIRSWQKQKKYFGNFMFFPALLQINMYTPHEKIEHIALFFLKAGTFVFGSGLAIVPFLYGGVVKEYHWLNEQQFLDAVAVAMITPGPVVITVGFIGYLVAGLPGACIAALATFVPCYLLTVLPAPYFRKYGKHPSIKAFVDGITAAAIGAIIGSVIVLAIRQLTDVTSLVLAIATLLFLLKFKKTPEPFVIAAAGLLGLLSRFYF